MYAIDAPLELLHVERHTGGVARAVNFCVRFGLEDGNASVRFAARARGAGARKKQESHTPDRRLRFHRDSMCLTSAIATTTTHAVLSIVFFLSQLRCLLRRFYPSI